MALSSCGWGGQPEAAPDLAFSDDDTTARYYVDTAMVDVPARADTDVLSTGLNPATICTSTDWDEAASAVFVALGDLPSSAPTVATGRGCRAVVSAQAGEIEVRLEVIEPESVEQVATFRSELAGEEPVPLMGFTELDFAESAERVSSSLLHPTLDRLEEHRWIVVDNRGFHLLLAVEPGGADGRPAVLEALETLESDLDDVLTGDAASLEESATPDPVVDALTDVLQAILDDRPLTDDQATDQGRQSIAFEYNLVPNLQGIATHRDRVDCTTGAAQADCTIAALDTIYRFVFVDGDGQWLLNDFRIEP